LIERKSIKASEVIFMQEYAEAKIQLLAPEHGGRTTPTTAIGCNYRPHVKLDSDSAYLGVCLVDGPEQLLPGTVTEVVFLLIYPEVDYAALVPGANFQILEGEHIVGSGTITRRWSEEG
jgi:translation elongation factor EF-Tu-like GTPase